MDIRAARPSLAVVTGIARKILGTARDPIVERASRGISTYVYRVSVGDAVLFLRMLPEIGDSFEPEAAVHQLLRRGVRVPGIVHLEPCHPEIGLSVMVTTAIPGDPLDRLGTFDGADTVLYEAGRDLAVINSLPVDGFGWIRRDAGAGSRLTGELPSRRDFVRQTLDESREAFAASLARDDLNTLAVILRRHDAWLDDDDARLAHGDIDATHIYAHDGAYAGLIDFGEMRGADPWYDLGHFLLRDLEHPCSPRYPLLLAGYASVTAPPRDLGERTGFAALLIALRELWRHQLKGRDFEQTVAAIRLLLQQLSATS